jgi:site-specific DNA-methyltransferase (adenine-specific)
MPTDAELMAAGARRVERVGDAVLVLGDCREIAPLLHCDHVITDPPFGDATHEGARSVTASRALITFASVTDQQFRDDCRRWVECARRWVILTCEWRHAATLEAAGLPLVRLGVWIKPNGAPQFTGDRPGTGWEAVAILHRAGRKRWNGGGHHAVWQYAKVSGEHPTQKPQPLLMRWIEDFTDDGEVVLDPFMGSGSTGVAALHAQRRFIGIEQDPRWFDLAVRRIAEAARQPSLFHAEPAPRPVQATLEYPVERMA